MKELVIISGKGGTGKTSIVASFAALAENKVMVDCDVDAADMHLILHPEIQKTVEFYSGKQAEILPDLCKKCGRCAEVCKFDAVNCHSGLDHPCHPGFDHSCHPGLDPGSHEILNQVQNDNMTLNQVQGDNNQVRGDNYVIDEIRCEGCGACYFNCPHSAIKFEQVKSGEWFESDTRFGKLIHAKLGIAEENSGKLVSEIKNHARTIAKANNNDLIIVDGSPGIGCPVIASISGAHLVVIVTEPTLSGIHDAQRVYELTQHFKIPACVCINKHDLNVELAEKITEFCREKTLSLVGKIPYSKEFTQAMIQGRSVVEYSQSDVSGKIKDMWDKIKEKI